MADAIALTRGDRFFTSEYTPYNLTAWGYADCQRDADGPGNGSILGRLLLRTLPGEYTNNSSYAWFPLMTPDAMNKILGKLGLANTYDLVRPVTAKEVPVFASYADVKQVLTDESNFGTGFPERVKLLVSGSGYAHVSAVDRRGWR